MIKRAIAIISALVMMALTGCSPAQSLTGNITPKAVSAADMTAEQAQSIAAFSEELFAKTLEYGDDNVAISPLSAYIALGMTAYGASGETAAAFEKTLGLNAAHTSEACLSLMKRLGDNSEGIQLNFANSIWADNALEVERPFLEGMATYYAADIFNLRLADPGTVKAVNDWISDKTNKLIPSMLDRIDPDAVMLLANAIYLNAEWMSKFNANLTKPMDFTRADGSVVTADFMSTGSTTMLHFETDEAEGIALPYKDENLLFMAAKPMQGGSITFDGNAIAGWLDASVDRNQVDVYMPKLSLAYDRDLGDSLKAMGLEIAFDMNRADFSAMGKSTKGNIFIGRVLQKAVVRVHEKGTEAAAATVVEMTAAGMMISNPYVIKFDSPYYFAIVDMQTGVPIFMGMVGDPSQIS